MLRGAVCAVQRCVPPRPLGPKELWLERLPTLEVLQELTRRSIVMPRLGDGFYAEPPIPRQYNMPWGDLTQAGMDHMKVQASELQGKPDLIMMPNWPGCVEAAQAMATGLCNGVGMREVWLQEAAEWVEEDGRAADGSALEALSALAPGTRSEGWSWADVADAAQTLGSASLAEECGARALHGSPAAAANAKLIESLALDEDSPRLLVVQQRSLCSLLAHLGLPASWAAQRLELLKDDRVLLDGQPVPDDLAKHALTLIASASSVE